MRVACDFDGVLHDPTNRLKGYKLGQPIEGAVEAIRQLRAQGHYIIIFPTWADNQKRRQALVDWLTYFNIGFDDITSVKPDADCYIDDRAVRFDNWLQALKAIRDVGQA